MTIAYLVPSGAPSPSTIIALGSYTDIAEGVASADGNSNRTFANDTTNDTAQWPLTNLPESPTSYNSATFRVRAEYINPGDQTDSATYLFRLSIGGDTYDLTWNQTRAGNGFENQEIDAGTHTEAQINAATVTLTQSAYSKSMGADDLYLSWDCFELEIDYNVIVPLWEQEGFRFRQDDGSESAATWEALQDTNVTLATETNYRLRVTSVVSVADPATATAILQYRKVGDPTWETVKNVS
jgi:hypothetical protein